MRILDPGSKAQDMGDSTNYVLLDPYVSVVSWAPRGCSHGRDSQSHVGLSIWAWTRPLDVAEVGSRLDAAGSAMNMRA